MAIMILKKFLPSKSFSFFLILPLVLTFLMGCSSQKTIVNGLDEKEANEIIVFLSTKGIDASKIPAKTSGAGGGGGGVALYDISVDAASATEAMAILNMNGLPRRRGQNLLNLFQSGGLVPSDMEEKIRYQAGLAEQIASTIRKIDGILDADVQLSFPEEDPLNPGKTVGKVTASVYVKHQGVLDDPNSHLITKIKRLVASSVNGLDFDNVTVISDRARFSDISIPGLQGGVPEEEKDYSKVWGIIVAKDSVGRFQTTFFSLVLIILILILLLVWMFWKLLPVIREGGFRQLFSLHSAHKKGVETKSDKSDKPPEKGDDKKKEEPKDKEEKKEGEPPKDGKNDETAEAS